MIDYIYCFPVAKMTTSLKPEIHFMFGDFLHGRFNVSIPLQIKDIVYLKDALCV